MSNWFDASIKRQVDFEKKFYNAEGAIGAF